MRRWASYFLSMIIVFVVLIILDFGLVMGVSMGTHGDRYFVPIGRISDSITKENDSYVIEEKRLEQLDELNAFLFIIGEDGRIAWQHNKPEDVPELFSLTDVARFTRWYLHDYPVYTWVRDDGILVIGLPKNSLWKYTLEFRLETLKTMITYIPYLVLVNILLIVLIPAWITKRWVHIRERQRTEWIAGVSHDIRTPLSIVMGNAEKGGIIEKQCFKIRDLVNNLNTENKLEAGTGKWNETEIKLAALIREIVCDYMNLGEEQYSFDLDINGELEDAVICADESLIRRMIDNLISNAIDHNESGCKVEVSMKKYSKGRIMLRITDNGKGVSEDLLKTMNGRLKHDYLPEHGLGIRVVKQIAKKYRYKVNFKSETGKYFESSILVRWGRFF
ncbi:MAG: sensor histidine kinase [Lachnospiraceae bacterium]